ncbi:hypothetical protein Tco_1424643 [Tanacetum coccineum]
MIPKAVLMRYGLVSLTTARPKAVINVVKGNQVNAIKASACWVWKPKTKGNPQQDLEEKRVIDSGCSRHMTGNMSYLTDFEEIDGGYVTFGGNPKRGKIIGRGTIKTSNLEFENMYFVRELQFNLFSVSQMCDKKNSVLFNDTECIVLSPNFKLTDESHVLLKVPRKKNMYSVDLKNIVPKGGLTCVWQILNVSKAQEEMSKVSEMPTDPYHTPIITQPLSSQPQKKQKSRRPKKKDTQVPQPSDPTNVADEAVNEEPKASLGDQEDASKQGRKIDDIDKDAEITLVDETQGRYGDEDMFRVHDLDGDEVVIESEVTDKAGEKRNIVEEAVVVTDVVTIPVSATTITNVVKSQGSKDKGKAKMIKLEKPLKKKDQIQFDKEEALMLQAEFDEEDRLAREKAQQVEEANIA